MYGLGSKSSVIRELFAYGLERKKVVGEDKVYDFSLGNPSIPAPHEVKDALMKLLEEPAEVLHSYSPASGDPKAKQMLAESVNHRFGTHFSGDNFYMTVGAAASLNISINAIANPGDEFITFAPFFPEYTVWVENAGAKLLINPADTKSFQIDFDAFEKLLSPKTKGIIINSPNNPSGVVYSEETIQKLSAVLEKKEQEYGHTIYLISDEPYREIVYDVLEVPYVTKYYNDTFVCYSYSKSLSLPGERIGYIIVPDEMADSKRVMAAVNGAGRALGFVCAPVLFQKAVAMCADVPSDIEAYARNKDLLYNGLTELGYECVRPQGAFYLFVKSPEKSGDAGEFSERAKKYDVLVVPSDSFGCPGYVRISYCVAEKTIVDSLPVFKKIMEELKAEN